MRVDFQPHRPFLHCLDRSDVVGVHGPGQQIRVATTRSEAVFAARAGCRWLRGRDARPGTVPALMESALDCGRASHRHLGGASSCGLRGFPRSIARDLLLEHGCPDEAGEVPATARVPCKTRGDSTSPLNSEVIPPAQMLSPSPVNEQRRTREGPLVRISVLPRTPSPFTRSQTTSAPRCRRPSSFGAREAPPCGGQPRQPLPRAPPPIASMSAGRGHVCRPARAAAGTPDRSRAETSRRRSQTSSNTARRQPKFSVAMQRTPLSVRGRTARVRSWSATGPSWWRLLISHDGHGVVQRAEPARRGARRLRDVPRPLGPRHASQSSAASTSSSI